MRKCWNCGATTDDENSRVCSDEICQRAELKSQRGDFKHKSIVENNKRAVEYQREYWQRSEVKKRKREYMREYQRSPEAKAKAREYQQRPEVKERAREYQREYRQRSEVKEQKRKYMREYMRERYHRLKKLREEE